MEKKIQCLLVEDDIDDQEIFTMCLRKIDKNIECRISNNGVEAITLLNSNDSYIPDFIFMDVNMPKMNGIECLKKVKEMERLKKAKVFMYSTTSEKSVLSQSKELGADEFIVKPAKAQILKEKLATIFTICQHIKR